MESINNLNLSQRYTLKTLLEGNENVFLTGAAGTGKSHVIKLYRRISQMQNKTIPIVASTGAASIIVNGITFNSYFGLGIMAGGPEVTIDKALTKRSVCERIVYADTIIVDEISMISGEVFETANKLCQKIRKNKKFFGGIRIITVGDFAQLGPYSEVDSIDWVFKNKSWKSAKFNLIHLTEVMRTSDDTFLDVLGIIRKGKSTQVVTKFLNKYKYKGNPADFEGARIFSRNRDVDEYNVSKLKSLDGKMVTYKTKFVGEEFYINNLKKNLVIKDEIALKKGSLVMTRVNNKSEGYINGTMGYVIAITNNKLKIRTLDGKTILVSPHVFEYLDGSGKLVAAAKNFPITLAWAITIQKSQGSSLDSALIDLNRLWLPGQAYTALSRLKSPNGLHILSWDKKSIIADKDVLTFYKKGRNVQEKGEKDLLKLEKKNKRVRKKK
jgi:ATP-dependent DNA helicase PIF1